MDVGTFLHTKGLLNYGKTEFADVNHPYNVNRIQTSASASHTTLIPVNSHSLNGSRLLSPRSRVWSGLTSFSPRFTKARANDSPPMPGRHYSLSPFQRTKFLDTGIYLVSQKPIQKKQTKQQKRIQKNETNNTKTNQNEFKRN
jgi:hypothetical protein